MIQIKLIVGLLGLWVPTMVGFPVIVIAPNRVNVTAGFTITSTGTYLLSDDVVATAVTLGNNAISITSSHVVLDLNNKSIISSGGGGIRLNNAGDVVIRNGRIFNCGDSGITGTNVTNVTVENINSSSNAVMGINLSGGSQWFIRNCITEANTFTGISAAGKDVEITNCISENNRSAVTFNGENGIITGGRFNRNSSSGITIVTSTQVVIERVQANENNGFAGIAVQSGADIYINACLAQKNTNTGIALINTVAFSAVRNSTALHNGVDGFGNNSGNSTFAGNFAFANVSNNYGGTGPLGFMILSNGGQFPLGSVSDQTNNVSVI